MYHVMDVEWSCDVMDVEWPCDVSYDGCRVVM